MRKFHLLKDFGVHKSGIRRNLPDTVDDQVLELLNRRTQLYTIDELWCLFGYLWTAHDECVVNNSHEFTSLQLYVSSRKISSAQEAIETLRDKTRIHAIELTGGRWWDLFCSKKCFVTLYKDEPHMIFEDTKTFKLETGVEFQIGKHICLGCGKSLFLKGAEHE